MGKNEVDSTANLAVVILAADRLAADVGARLKSRRPQVMHEVGGKSLLSHVIAAAAQVVDQAHIYVVVGHQADRVKAAVAATGVHFIEQAEPGDVGHALRCASESIAGYENILVLPGDLPLIKPETIRRLWQFHLAEQAAMTILTAAPADLAQQHAPKVRPGIYAFKTAPLLQHLPRLDANNAQRELDIAGLAALIGTAGERIANLEATDAAEVLGGNTIAELVAIDATLRTATAARLMASGVTIFRPETCVIDADVQIEPGTVIEPFVQLLGSTRIGAECTIRSYSVVENCTLGNNVLLRQGCILSDSTVGDGAKIGPFAHLRPGSEIGEDAHVGNFVETKKAKLGKGAKANHLSYLGDAEVGEGSNIGAGVITCNYDGVHKHPTRIGKGVFVGSDSTLVAPITIGEGAYIGAGSCITKDVPAGALAVGRGRQFNKEGWVAVRRAAKKPKD
jgi:bifunctional UDP-N-acetylglucosamine pyrophosphorylase/glucosamine-1-phosphate N-acetyltransferase